MISSENQLTIMRKQLSAFDSIFEKLTYLDFFFGPDPEFTKDNMDIILEELRQSLRQGTL